MRTRKPIEWPKTKKVVYVEWDDAWASAKWSDIEHVGREPLRCVSIGIVLERTKEHILLAQSWSEDNQTIAGEHSIPSKMVKRIVPFGSVKQKPRKK